MKERRQKPKKRDDRWYLNEALERIIGHAMKMRNGRWVVWEEDVEFSRDVLSSLEESK